MRAAHMQSIRRFGEAFCQLEWHDRLNVILAMILELALVLVLSPILLISWLCLLFAKRRVPPKRANLAFTSQRP
jgi:hypothetical protein